MRMKGEGKEEHITTTNERNKRRKKKRERRQGMLRLWMMRTPTNTSQLESSLFIIKVLHNIPTNLSSLGVVLEENAVMDNINNLPQAMCLLFGLTYALHLNYPKCMVNTFQFVQQVFLGLGRKELKGKVLNLTNQLAM
ncbi:sterile alpha motif domain-containing protein 3 isoform X1 [Astyanax mexicanus]|uniref:Sterile alpha motif domain-containing protein 3 isoform X1 n=1 Tax=Astyanax mexicanus TaxID=7994 RepID=A0A8T2LVL3_ASTMX|nr:sterile alpha motif domain-containing protein 3 isoform X1 [Astyanax mexicanus]